MSDMDRIIRRIDGEQPERLEWAPVYVGTVMDDGDTVIWRGVYVSLQSALDDTARVAVADLRADAKLAVWEIDTQAPVRTWWLELDAGSAVRACTVEQVPVKV